MPTHIRTRTPLWPKVMGATLPLLTVMGLGTWWFVGRESGYYIRTSDARGIQAGDPVVRNGVRVGQVVDIEAVDQGAPVEIQLAGAEVLHRGDMLRIRRGLLAATAEVELERACQRPEASESDQGVLPYGSMLEEAGRLAIAATRARCSALGQRIENILISGAMDHAVQTFEEAIEQSKEWGSDTAVDAGEFLRQKGAELADRLERSGLPAKADSIRALIRERVGRP